MRQLRVGLIHWAMPPTTGGVESHVADLALALTELGSLVTVLTGEMRPSLLSGVEIISLPLLNLEEHRRLSLSQAVLERELKQEFRDIISSRNLQVLHGHNLHHFISAPALVLNELREESGFRLYHTFHETWPDLLHDHPVYRCWDGNYAVSRFVQDECARYIGFRPHLLPLGIDTERFRSSRPPMTGGDPLVILHPARLLPWKGVHVVVDMLSELLKRDIAARLIITDTQRIIDWDEELVKYRRLIFERLCHQGLMEMVEFRSLPYAQMHQLYEEADVVVYPTVGDEPYGLVPLEAMSMERPVIGSRSGGITETIIEGKTGFLVERDDAAALADGVEWLFRNPERSRHMGRVGRRHVVAHFNGRDYATRLHEQYLNPCNKSDRL